jgi:hypothetical protein
MAVLISPVKAPDPSQCTFCAARAVELSLNAWPTAARAVDGGAMAESTPPASDTRGRNCSTNSTDWEIVLFIFQFAAINGLLAMVLPPGVKMKKDLIILVYPIYAYPDIRSTLLIPPSLFDKIKSISPQGTQGCTG